MALDYHKTIDIKRKGIKLLNVFVHTKETNGRKRERLMISLANWASQLIMSFAVQYKLDLHAVYFSNTEGSQRQLHIYSVIIIHLELSESDVTMLCVSISKLVKRIYRTTHSDKSAKIYPTTSSKKLCSIHKTHGPIHD